MTKPSLVDAIDKLSGARTQYSVAKSSADAARREETAALNVLNDAQKAFDAAVEATRADAPWDSDWHSRKRGGVEVAS